MKKLYLLFLLLISVPLFVSAQDSDQKEEILNARKSEKEKRKNREYCDKLTFQQGFSEGLAKISVNGKVGFINTKGEIVIQPKLKDAGYFSENLAPFENKSGKWGFINKNGEIVIKPRFGWALSFSEGLALVQVGELWGYIDRSL